MNFIPYDHVKAVPQMGCGVIWVKNKLVICLDGSVGTDEAALIDFKGETVVIYIMAVFSEGMRCADKDVLNISSVGEVSGRVKVFVVQRFDDFGFSGADQQHSHARKILLWITVDDVFDQRVFAGSDACP